MTSGTDVVLWGGTVVDIECAAPADAVAMIIIGGRIEEVRTVSGKPPFAGAVDTRGTVIIPGVMEDHLHLKRNDALSWGHFAPPESLEGDESRPDGWA